ncbi:Down-regulator of transcription 1 [Tyrophagus putrescentiae]|nr:Down-regulator of transcription 1 [Tyrophagus putrescentiae]
MASNDKDDEELTIPRAAINKLIKEVVPDVRVANDSRELILQCCSEFIHRITTEANTICEGQQKKTMSAEHVLAALDKLGFSHYKTEAESVVNDCRRKRRRQSTRLEHLGIPEEELLRQQQELFAKARQEQALIEQQEWLQLQNATSRAQEEQNSLNNSTAANDDEEY